MTTLELRFTKGADGRIAAFALHRGVGTFTVHRHPHEFFPAHDFTHYAVETTLRDALIAQWHAVPLGETRTLRFDPERLAIGS